jgi:predicted nucleic acid-binding protein
VFVDTSALYAYADRDDDQHENVLRAWDGLEQAGVPQITSNYVLTEASAVIQGRLGMAAVQDFLVAIVPVLGIQWVDRETHDAAVAALLSANRRDLSLVDCVSFEVMRRLGIRRAFTVDEHFREQGFEVVP